MKLYDTFYSRGMMDPSSPLPRKAKAGTLATCTSDEAQYLVRQLGSWREITRHEFDEKLEHLLHGEGENHDN